MQRTGQIGMQTRLAGLSAYVNIRSCNALSFVPVLDEFHFSTISCIA